MWLSVNPGAGFAGELCRARTFEEDAAVNPQPFGRLIPAVTLAVILAMLALHHWNVVVNRSVYASVVLLLTPIGGLALGGTIYPPLFYSIGRYGRELPTYLKVLGGLCAVGGLAAGFYLLFVVYAF